MKIVVPLRTVSVPNQREHHMAKHRRVKAERKAVAWLLNGKQLPPPPVVVTLTRLSPHHTPLDDDNLTGALKAVRDEVAKYLGVDDGNTAMVRFVYAQRREDWGVEIGIDSANGTVTDS